MKYLNYFKNKKILITGHTGFKGSWSILVLKFLGAKLYGISNGYVSNPSMFKKLKLHKQLQKNFIFDISNYSKLKKTIEVIEPDIILHMAAQALVFKSYTLPFQTMQTNTFGTINLLEIIRNIKFKCTILIITSDKVYKNVEKKSPYFENDEIYGIDPYSASKSMAEIAINSYIKSYLIRKKNINIGIARAGNVIGGGDWAENRIVPDCIKSWTKLKPAKIRNPESTRPWQHVLEPIFGYILFIYYLSKNRKFNGEILNFGPDSKNNYSVIKLINNIGKIWPYNKVRINKIKFKLYESKLLNISSLKAKKLIGWRPILNFTETANFISDWYYNFYFNKKINIYDFSLNQIDQYLKKWNR